MAPPPQMVKGKLNMTLSRVVSPIPCSVHLLTLLEPPDSFAYDSDTPYSSTPAQVLRSFQLLPEEEVEELEALGLHVSAAAAAIEREDDLFADAPDDFVDQLTGAVMEDPITLPKSGVTLDRASIMRHLLSSQTDPFSRRGRLCCPWN